MQKKIILLAVTGIFIFSGFINKPEKTIVGSWYNPPTYESSGKLKGFTFKKDGTCKAVGIPSLELKTWSIKDGNLVIDGIEINEDGSRSVYHSIKPIALLTKDSLRVFDSEKRRATFLYLNTKTLKAKR